MKNILLAIFFEIYCQIEDFYLNTVSSGIQDGLILKLGGKKSVLYSRLSNFYVGIRRCIFKNLVLYSRSSFIPEDTVFQKWKRIFQ